MEIDQLQKDIQLQRERIKKMKGPPDMRAELSDNLWPWLDAMLETIVKVLAEQDEELDDHAAAIDELIGRSQSTIQADLAMRIAALTTLGAQIAADFGDFLKAQPDSPRKQRALAAIDQYSQLYMPVMNEVGQATLKPEDGNGADADADEGEDEDVDGEEDDDLDDDVEDDVAGEEP